MRTDQTGHYTIVILSRRNLLALLAKLDGYPKGSAAALVGGAEAARTIVVAEEDDEHYGQRAPGAVHPDTEARIQKDPRCSGSGYAHGPHGDCPGYSTDRT